VTIIPAVPSSLPEFSCACFAVHQAEQNHFHFCVRCFFSCSNVLTRLANCGSVCKSTLKLPLAQAARRMPPAARCICNVHTHCLTGRGSRTAPKSHLTAILDFTRTGRSCALGRFSTFDIQIFGSGVFEVKSKCQASIVHQADKPTEAAHLCNTAPLHLHYFLEAIQVDLGQNRLIFKSSLRNGLYQLKTSI
jgi:hypothetical protein